MARVGALYVLSGPSGVGKSTLRARLLARIERLSYSVSCTTRPPRPGEREGRDYHFVSEEAFQGLIARGAFLEWARVFGHGYGTLKETVWERIRAGWDVVLEIDVQGAAQIRRRARSFPTDVHFLFVLPPSLAALSERLKRRQTEGPEALHRRLTAARAELDHAPRFEYLVVNREVGEAVRALGHFIHAAQADPHGG